MRSTRWRDGVRFEEVSLGYPAQWRQSNTVDDYLRPILPAPPPVPGWGHDAHRPAPLVTDRGARARQPLQ
jgi:hypothetical protein